MNELNELQDQAYENSLIYKEKTKKIHDSKIKNNVGDRVRLFNSRLKIFSGKLKTRWTGPFTVTKVFPYGTIKLSQTDGPNFKMNGHRLKHYFGGDIPPVVVPDLQNFPMEGSSQTRDSVNKNKRFSGGNPCFYLIFLFSNKCDERRLASSFLVFRVLCFMFRIASDYEDSHARGFVHQIPSGESKVHIEVLSVLWGNRLPILDGSLPLSRNPIGCKDVEYDIRAQMMDLEFVVNQGLRLKLKNSPHGLEPSLMCYK
ncbi:hypothetical protein Tco_0508251 [Tanacetum coccineum]